MTPPDLDALEALAKAAAPGPWRAEHRGVRRGPASGMGAGMHTNHIATTRDPIDTQYIAAASPDVVLALIARLRRVRSELFELSVLILEETGYDDTNPEDAIKRCAQARDEAQNRQLPPCV